mgnify:CR=1 FL=1
MIKKYGTGLTSTILYLFNFLILGVETTFIIGSVVFLIFIFIDYATKIIQITNAVIVEHDYNISIYEAYKEAKARELYKSRRARHQFISKLTLYLTIIILSLLVNVFISNSMPFALEYSNGLVAFVFFLFIIFEFQSILENLETKTVIEIEEDNKKNVKKEEFVLYTLKDELLKFFNSIKPSKRFENLEKSNEKVDTEEQSKEELNKPSQETSEDISGVDLLYGDLGKEEDKNE